MIFISRGQCAATVNKLKDEVRYFITHYVRMNGNFVIEKRVDINPLLKL